MDKKILWIIVALVILLAGVGFFVMSNTNKSNQTTQSTQTVEITPTQAPKEKKSLKEFLTLGQAQQCSFNTETGGSGTVYLGNSSSLNKMRGDFETQTSGQTVKSHMILDNQTAYIWMDGQNSGFKMSTEGSTQASPNANQALDLNQKVDYNCQPWSVDATVFNLPTNVKFSDFSAFKTPASGSATQNTKAMQCASCDGAPESARAQCKAALGCK